MRNAALDPLHSGAHPPEQSQDVDDFIYLVSHDLRASVRALLELPQWIVEDLAEAGVEVGEPVAQSIALMNRHTARLDRMLVDLLAYSRVGRMQDVVQVDLAAALDEVLIEMNPPEGMKITRDIACTHAMMDARDVLTLWSALIGNAVKHHHSVKGRITATTFTEGAMVRFTVCDDGPGIPERLYAKALGAMTTLRPRDQVEGTGMGLAILQKMVAYYGGTLTLSYAQADGTGLRVDMVLPHGGFEVR